MKDRKKKPVVVTHNGKFHADDVFAVAVLNLVLGDIKIVRSREDDIIQKADYVVDVGFVYDPEKNRFDHHQKEGAGKRENAISYASFGLIWRHFSGLLSENKLVLNKIDELLVQPIDTVDNGVSLSTENNAIKPYEIDNLIDSLNLSWEEAISIEDERFLEAVKIAKRTVERLIIRFESEERAKNFITEDYKKSEDKKIIILSDGYPWKEAIREFEEPLFVIFPVYAEDKWVVHTVRSEADRFASRRPFPESWGGKQGEDLFKETKVNDAIFCHRGLFICATKSKEGAIKLAKKALEE